MGDTLVHINFPNKYRPRIFSEVAGQTVLVKILSNAIKLNRVGHAFLFSGSYGIGKTTIARVFASSLNCLSGPTVTPCMQCASCAGIKTFSHPDVIEIDAASNTSVENIRTIIEDSIYSPVLSKFKIYIIDEVHMLSSSAFNALLKTLEEHKEYVKFIFATTELQKIPPTVISRCMHFNLVRPSNSIVADHLKKIAKLEKLSIDDDAVELIAENSSGSFRDALSMLEQSSLYSDDYISYDAVKESFGLVSGAKIRLLLSSILKNSAQDVLNIFEDICCSGYDIILILQDILRSLHKIIKCKLVSGDIRDQEFESYDLSLLSRLSTCLIDGISDVKNSLNQYIVAEILLLKLCFLLNLPSPKELASLYQSSCDAGTVSLDKKGDSCYIGGDSIENSLASCILKEFHGSEVV